MQKITLYTITKSYPKPYKEIIDEFIKMSSKYSKVSFVNIFDKHIAKASTKVDAQKSYTQAYEKFLSSSFNIALDLSGKELDSFTLSNVISKHSDINFFIGGAYGFEDEFLQKCDLKISLSNLTMAHKVANIVLCEQVFRSLAIINNHPYHK
jgi:23S rRNA (pseudouridine1915-N3)-methyltransferase